MRKKDAAAIALMVWMLTMSGLMSTLPAPDIRLFIAIALVGFFIVIYIIHPMYSKPGYIRNIYRMAVVCTALFGVVISLRILELIQY
jgi:hypothetical protein